jgi:urea transport system permease protein
MNASLSKLVGGKQGLINLGILAAVIFVVLPLGVDIFRLNLIGKYLTYAFVASKFGVVVG